MEGMQFVAVMGGIGFWALGEVCVVVAAAVAVVVAVVDVAVVVLAAVVVVVVVVVLVADVGDPVVLEAGAGVIE